MGHVLGSADAETMILNTLAAMFVFEVDDIIYNLMVSPLHQFWVEKTFSLTKAFKQFPAFNFIVSGLFLLFICWYVLWIIFFGVMYLDIGIQSLLRLLLIQHLLTLHLLTLLLVQLENF